MPKTFGDLLSTRCSKEEAEAYHNALRPAAEVLGRAISASIEGQPPSVASDGAALMALADAAARALARVDDPNGVRLAFFLMMLVDGLEAYRPLRKWSED